MLWLGGNKRSLSASPGGWSRSQRHTSNNSNDTGMIFRDRVGFGNDHKHQDLTGLFQLFFERQKTLRLTENLRAVIEITFGSLVIGKRPPA